MKAGISTSWIILQTLSYVIGHGYEGGDFDGWYQPVPHRPVDIITDVVNDIGIRILQQYTAHGNVAFSPSGVGFVLAALYEGSTGRGSHQIAEALGLPRDRDITRIGFRDIHRRLRTYLNADGFLGGLTLNQENTRLHPEYENVLRFYGFDLSTVEEESNETTPIPETTTVDAVTEHPMPEEETTTTTTTTPTTTTTTTTTTELATDATTTELINGETSSSGTEDLDTLSTTTTSPVELLSMTLNTMNVQDRLTQTTTSSGTTITTDAPDGLEIPTTTNLQTSGQQDSTSFEETSGTTSIPQISDTITTTVSPSVSEITSTPSIEEEGTTITTVTDNLQITTVNASPQDGSTGIEMVSTTVSTTDVVSTETTSTVTSVVDGVLSTIGETSTVSIAETEGTTVSSLTEAPGTIGVTELAQESTTTSSTPNTDATTIQVTTILSTDASMDEASINATQDSESSTILENSGSVVTDATTNPPGTAENTVSTDLSTNETVSIDEIRSTESTATTVITDEVAAATEGQQSTTLSSTTKDDSVNQVRRRSVRSLKGYFSSYPDDGTWMQDLGIWKPYSPTQSEASVRDSTEILFLVNGCDVSSVTATKYIAVLPFAYFPSLHAVAIEFPLDDPRYNILLFMSTDRRDTYRLARDLGGKSLRLLRKQLQPTWVRATIPSFMLRGFVTLTSFLQRLGIVDVFEPRAADLSPMTPDPGVYVRDVQQSIGVNIRNYMKPDRTHSRNGLFERAGPVPFTAVHPFLYFIVDAETSVALIAGRINDPLNSRIL